MEQQVRVRFVKEPNPILMGLEFFALWALTGVFIANTGIMPGLAAAVVGFFLGGFLVMLTVMIPIVGILMCVVWGLVFGILSYNWFGGILGALILGVIGAGIRFYEFQRVRDFHG